MQRLIIGILLVISLAATGCQRLPGAGSASVSPSTSPSASAGTSASTAASPSPSGSYSAGGAGY